MRTGTLKSDTLLLLAAVVWGFAFVAQRVGMDYVGPFTFNAVRFALGALVLVPFVVAGRKASSENSENRGHGTTESCFSSDALPGTPANEADVGTSGGIRQFRSPPSILAVLAGLVLFAGASLQQIGIVYTTAGKAGFITGLYVILVPILGLLWKQRPGWGTWVGVAAATAGLYLLSAAEGLTLAPGDSLVLASAVFWAVHVLMIGWLSPRSNPLRIAAIQFATCSILSWIAAIAVEEIALAGILGAAIPILYGGVLSVGLAYTLQVVAQRKAPAAHAAIILSLETVFAAVGGWLVLGEVLTQRALLGCALMLAGILVSRLSRRSEV
ncbi:MAG: DMT family transporter [Candidatus Eisenbacteria sp.]|nr:DMT family transporter [Candidatus Eisenbacteria bacterium]